MVKESKMISNTLIPLGYMESRVPINVHSKKGHCPPFFVARPYIFFDIILRFFLIQYLLWRNFFLNGEVELEFPKQECMV